VLSNTVIRHRKVADPNTFGFALDMAFMHSCVML